MIDTIFDREASKPREVYFNEGYFNRKQLDSLVSQIAEVYKLKPNDILEIGLGNGFVSKFLKSSGFRVTTFDINGTLDPDVIGNIIEIEKYFSPNSFDLILCAEVLEHIPFKYFDSILEKLKCITKANVLITLPRSYRVLLDYRAYLKVPLIKPLTSNIFYTIPDRRSIWDGHCWQIDFKPEFSLKKVSELISKHFIIKNIYVDERNRTHQFFVLEI